MKTPQIPKRLADAIFSEDITLARSILIGLLNKNFLQAHVAFQYAIQQVSVILEVHDEELYPIDRDPSSWTEDYWHGLTGDQMRNFSRERFEHLIEVGSKLFPERAVGNNASQSSQHVSHSESTENNESNNSNAVIYEQPNKTWDPKDTNTKGRLDSAIRDQDVSMARSIVIGLANKNFGEALRAFIYAGDRMPELLQQHDGDLYPMYNNNATWSEDYWHSITGDLMRNFSKERFQHLCDVGAYILPNRPSHEVEPSKSFKEPKQPDFKQQIPHQSDNSKRVVYIVLAIGIVIVIPWIIWMLFFP